MVSMPIRHCTALSRIENIKAQLSRVNNILDELKTLHDVYTEDMAKEASYPDKIWRGKSCNYKLLAQAMVSILACEIGVPILTFNAAYLRSFARSQGHQGSN